MLGFLISMFCVLGACRWDKLWTSFLTEGLLSRELLEQYLWKDVQVCVRSQAARSASLSG